MASDTLFREKAPDIMRMLMADFGLSVEEAAAILGNIGHECAGFRLMQEVKPTVAGSRGGYGWCQWTGPRRRAFEAYCERNALDPSSDKANYGYLFVELKGLEGSEQGAIPALKRAGDSLRAKVEAFERAFLRAGVKHYDSRTMWAERALSAYRAVHAATGKPADERLPSPAPGQPGSTKPSPRSQEGGGKGVAAGLAGLLAALLVAGGAAVGKILGWW